MHICFCVMFAYTCSLDIFFCSSLTRSLTERGAHGLAVLVGQQTLLIVLFSYPSHCALRSSTTLSFPTVSGVPQTRGAHSGMCLTHQLDS